MDTKSGSRVTLSTNSSIDLFDGPAMEILENSDSGSSSPSEGSPVIRTHRHYASGSSYTLPRSYSPRPDQAMATVADRSCRTESLHEANSLLSPQSPDGSFAKVLVAPRRSYSVGRRESGSSLRYTPSPSVPLEEIKEGVSSTGANVLTSPRHTEKTDSRKDSLSGSLLSLPQCLPSPDSSCVEPISINERWKNHNVIMRVSSATGQLEEVHTRSQTLTKTTKVHQQRHSSYVSSPFSYSMMNLNFDGEDKGDTKIMNLSEEPQLVRRCNTLARSSFKRRSVILDSVSTDV